MNIRVEESVAWICEDESESPRLVMLVSYSWARGPRRAPVRSAPAGPHISARGLETPRLQVAAAEFIGLDKDHQCFLLSVWTCVLRTECEVMSVAMSGDALSSAEKGADG
jgi:hypothetical protein